MNGRVITMSPFQPLAEAIAIKKDKILRVGTNEAIRRCVGKNTKVISLNGKTVVPGFIDTHIHVVDFGRFLTWIDLNDVTSIKEMQSNLRKHAQKMPKGKWIVGRGWNQARFAEGRFPSLSDLDAASPDNPVILYHQRQQICAVNSRALELAGITEQTSAPPHEGAVDKNEHTGELTGILRNDATNLVWKIVPEPSEEELAEATGLACEKIVEAGVTSVHWMVLSSVEVSIIQKLRAQNRLPLRVYMIIPANLLDNVVSSRFHGDSADNTLRVGGVMISADGYLAARTAALFQPYSDSPAISGTLLCMQEEMNALAVKIHEANLQLVIHAMGDKAVSAALAAIEETSMKAPTKDFRNRIEQAAVLNKGLLQRMKKQEVIVSVQPRVIESEFSVWSAIDHLGYERARRLYPLKILLKEGIRVIGGSDCPMEPLNPLLGIQAAVTREFFPEERITVDDALRLYTVNAAYASSEENIKGSIEAGKLADIAVKPGEIGGIKAEMTIVGGKVVYPKSSL
jgi:predicted amidohydrolase YtcJ